MEKWLLLIFGVAALAGAGICFWYRRNVGQERMLMAATPTSKAADVAKLAPGTVVEVKGDLRCEKALTAEFSKESCAYYKAEIDREEVYYSTDSSGKRERKTRRYSLHSNIKYAPCTVEDGSGRAALNLEGGDIEGKLVVSRRETESQGAAMTVLKVVSGSENATLIYTETILPYDIPVYVLGEVLADHAIGKPVKGSNNRVFVVSQKSEEERSAAMARSMLWLAVGAVILAGIGAGLLIWALAKSTGAAP